MSQEPLSLHRWLPSPKERSGYPYVEGDIEWDACATVVYHVLCTVAGFFACMFGVGGGIAKGPLMLAMGVHQKVCHHHDAFGGALRGALFRLGRPLSPSPGLCVFAIHDASGDGLSARDGCYKLRLGQPPRQTRDPH